MQGKEKACITSTDFIKEGKFRIYSKYIYRRNKRRPSDLDSDVEG